MVRMSDLVRGVVREAPPRPAERAPEPAAEPAPAAGPTAPPASARPRAEPAAAARPGAASPGGGARDPHRAQRGLRTVARPASGPAARGARPRADPARFPLAASGGARRPRGHLARALAGPVLGGQQSGRAPRRGLPGLSSGAGGRHGDAHRREHRLRSPPAPHARARRLPDRRRTLADAGDPAATDRLADRRRAGGLSRPPAGVSRHRPALGALQRAHHPGRPRAPRARAGPGLPAGADRRGDRRRRQGPRAGRHVHQPHPAAERPPPPAPARGGARHRQVTPRELPVPADQGAALGDLGVSARHRRAPEHRGDRPRRSRSTATTRCGPGSRSWPTRAAIACRRPR